MTDKTNFLGVTICSEVTTFSGMTASLASVFCTKGVGIEAASIEDTFTRSSCIGAASIGGAGGASITGTYTRFAGVGDGCVRDACIRDVAAIWNARFKDDGAIKDIRFRDTGTVWDTCF